MNRNYFFYREVSIYFKISHIKFLKDMQGLSRKDFIEFDDDRSLYSHMKMEGSWHVYRPGERWRVPRHRARVALETDEWTAVCFDAPVMVAVSLLLMLFAATGLRIARREGLVLIAGYGAYVWMLWP